jgi:hypothetical protein
MVAMAGRIKQIGDGFAFQRIANLPYTAIVALCSPQRSANKNLAWERIPTTPRHYQRQALLIDAHTHIN